LSCLPIDTKPCHRPSPPLKIDDSPLARDRGAVVRRVPPSVASRWPASVMAHPFADRRPPSSASSACDACAGAIHGVAFVHRFVVDFEEFALVGVRPPPWLRSSSLCWLGRIQAVDVALELRRARRQLRPMWTGRSSPAFMRAYTVVRPIRSSPAASSGVSSSNSLCCALRSPSAVVTASPRPRRRPDANGRHGTSTGEGANVGRLVTAEA